MKALLSPLNKKQSLLYQYQSKREPERTWGSELTFLEESKFPFLFQSVVKISSKWASEYSNHSDWLNAD